MSNVKTCVVMGTFEIGEEKGNFFESDVFGVDCRFSTAHDFINYMRKDFLKHTSKYHITNVVIG